MMSIDVEDWGGIEGWLVEGDELPPLSNKAGVNQECAPRNVPPQHGEKILESPPENAPAAMAPSDKRASALPGWRPLPLAVTDVARHCGQAPPPDVLVAEKRFRSPDWSAEAKQAYLELKVEALRVVPGKPDWNYISQGLWERHKIDRSSKVCEYLWGTLRKDFRAIRDHEASRSGSVTSNWVSYWEMGEDERSRKKLPRVFPLEWCKMIERILAAQEKRSGKKTREIPEKESLGDEDNGNTQYSYLHPGEPSRDGSNQQTQGERPRLADRAELPNSKYTGREGSSAKIFEEDPLGKQLVEDAVSYALKHLGYGKRSGASSSQEDDVITMLSRLVKQQVQDSVNSTLQPLACRKRPEASIDANDLVIGVAPFVKQMIEDELSSALKPITSALQVLGQEEQEYHENLRALAEKRLALDREEILIKRQRVGRQQRSRRTPYNQQRLNM